MTVKVTMNLTNRDVQNTEKLKNLFHSRSKASAVSTVLSVTATIAEIISNGGSLMARKPDGTMEKLKKARGVN
jgi:hypothetical protein